MHKQHCISIMAQASDLVLLLWVTTALHLLHRSVSRFADDPSVCFAFIVTFLHSLDEY